MKFIFTCVIIMGLVLIGAFADTQNNHIESVMTSSQNIKPQITSITIPPDLTEFDVLAVYEIQDEFESDDLEIQMRVDITDQVNSDYIQIISHTQSGWESSEFEVIQKTDTVLRISFKPKSDKFALVQSDAQIRILESPESQTLLPNINMGDITNFQKPYIYVIGGIGVLIMFIIFAQFILRVRYESQIHKNFHSKNNHSQEKSQTPSQMPPPKDLHDPIDQKIIDLLRQQKSHGFIVNRLLDEGFEMEKINERFEKLSFSHPGFKN